MPKKVIISGGGTGGHIFPAVAIADAIKRLEPGTEILFVGANGRMEMERVPAAGYRIIGLDIQGFQRKALLKNFALPFKIIKSVLKARSIIRDFKPDVAVGVGGYASGPLLYAAGMMKIPYLIQEQNSFAGITNKWLAKKAACICVAFEGMEKFFPAEKILVTGNPVRIASVEIENKREEAAQFFGLSASKKTILVTGGSLGAGTLNKSMLNALDKLIAQDVQLIWQTGKFYYKGIIEKFGNQPKALGIRVLEFLQRMDLAYSLADVIISRAGAGTIAELCLVEKPVILVPSPNVAEDHQTMNARSLVKFDAAVMVSDAEAENILADTVVELLKDDVKLARLSENIAKLGKPDADVVIAKEVFKLSASSPESEPSHSKPGIELQQIKQVYLIGIGGIGMSALARYFNHKGCVVSGYDRTSTVLTSQLIKERIAVSFEDKKAALPELFRAPSESILVIYTPAIPKDSELLNYFQSNGFELKKRSEVLGIISRGMFTIAVAGTHGKTTTSSMIAHILKDCGHDCAAFLGGIATNYGSNVLFGNGPVVIEADEYDRSFLQLHPDIAVVTSMDADHLDIYGDESHLHESFQLFAKQLKPKGRIFVKYGLPIKGITYSANGDSALRASNIKVANGNFVFDFEDGRNSIKELNLAMPGKHNVENAVAAIGVALSLGIRTNRVKAAVATFKGVKRRFEIHINNAQHVYIDDYAHHPEELRACFDAVRQLHPDKKLTVIFQPHLFSRTRDFVDGFAEVLSMADELILLEIYPAREKPIPGVSSLIILEKLSLSSAAIYNKEAALQKISEKRPALLLTVGAGDIDTMVEPLNDILNHA